MTTGRINQITIVIVIRPSPSHEDLGKAENNGIVFIKVTLIIKYRKASIFRALVPNANRIVFEIN